MFPMKRALMTTLSFELQNANEFRALFKIPQSHPSESWGSPTSNDLLAEARNTVAGG